VTALSTAAAFGGNRETRSSNGTFAHRMPSHVGAAIASTGPMTGLVRPALYRLPKMPTSVLLTLFCTRVLVPDVK
jgi:hypothetical protein